MHGHSLRPPTEESHARSASPGGPAQQTPTDSFFIKPPTLSLPKGGGAIRGIGEKFTANPVTGTGTISVPIAVSPGRAGFGPQLALMYDSGSGNGPFGLGWSLPLPSIARKTDKGIPQYREDDASDVFVMSGAEDLVPLQESAMGALPRETAQLDGVSYAVQRYRPRIEGLFARIERWSQVDAPENTCWRTITRENVTTWYGQNENSRIVDPSDRRRIFQWLICLTHDDKGNAAIYRYAADDDAYPDPVPVAEANRLPEARRANRYLKSIRYGNVEPYLPRLGPDDADPLPAQWLFEVVLDYGDHAGEFPSPAPDADPPRSSWTHRVDAFSTHRAGFEVRTYRLCRRVLMYHHFPDVLEVGANCLVRSTELAYALASTPEEPRSPGFTTLVSVTHASYQRTAPGSATYHRRDLPPVGFTYSEPVVDPTIQSVDAAQLENLPAGLEGQGYRWIDLDGEGLSGVLAESIDGWYYKPGRGDGTFGPSRVLATRPAMALDPESRYQFMDLAGDGALDVVSFQGTAPGFFERETDREWSRHVPFARLANVDWEDRNLRFVDLSGDGLADALITEHDVFTWYPSLGEQGFAAAERAPVPPDEAVGPRVLFADGTQTIFLADMCGDGLTDLVRICNGDVCYWPNLGYGRFGRKVTVGNAPLFDHGDLFDPRRIRLADIDGSGPIDLIYLGRDGARLYFNRSGNSFSDALPVALPVATENLDAVQVTDLLGNGTACLVWSSHLPADARRQVRYVDLMAGPRATAALVQSHRRHEKPHLLIRIDNHLGATTTIEYTPSTRFYLQDLAAGKPWATRLPFPVHCVSKVTVEDRWRRTSFSSTYTYHHGYFDGVEREFRGFGRVEQCDTQAFADVAAANTDSPFVTDDHTLYQPPVKTVTWFHTGTADDPQRILGLFEREYLPARMAERFAAAGYTEPVPAPPIVEEGGPPLEGDEWREAVRALRGMPLRREVYELDVQRMEEGREVPVRVFSAAQHAYRIRRLHARGTGRFAVFLAFESEAWTSHYELDLTTDDDVDPRIAHTFRLMVDDYGQAVQSVAVVYPRRAAFQPPADLTPPLNPSQLALIRAVQAERHISYTEARFTRELPFSLLHHRPPMACEVRTFELSGGDPGTGFRPRSGSYFAAADFRAYALSDTLPGQGARPVRRIGYHAQPDSDAAHMRLIEHVCTKYWNDASDAAPPNAVLELGVHSPRGLKCEDYKLALTGALLTAVLGDRLASDVAGAVSVNDYLARPARPGFPYLKSGYIAGAAIDAAFADQYWMRSGVAGFAANAHQRFFMPDRYNDPFGAETALSYDAPFCLHLVSSRDALGNTVSVEGFDYRVLAPTRMRDANDNVSAVAFDVRGLAVASALLGKASGIPSETGDRLNLFDVDALNPSSADVAAFFAAADVDQVQARRWLGRATARFFYHFGEERNAAGDVVRWEAAPAAACAVSRERHERDAPNDEPELGEDGIPIQIAFEYSDGGGQTFVTKAQAEPEEDGGPLRWIANGLVIANNKGNPVLQYEPYFSTSGHLYQVPSAEGVSAVMYYDASGRLVRTEFPDGTLSRVEFSPWVSRSFDPNDTVLESAWLTANAQSADVQKRRAAVLASRHAATPEETHLDTLGRAVISIVHNCRPDLTTADATPLEDRTWDHERHLTFTKLDAEAKPLWIVDARGNKVIQFVTPPAANHTPLYDDPAEWRPAYDMPPGAVPGYDIAGNLLFQHGMDGGDRRMLSDASGQPMLAWDENHFQAGAGAPAVQSRVFRTEHDELHRPVEHWLRIDGADMLVEAFDYCDTSSPRGAANLADAIARNLITWAVRHWDPSGLARLQRVDVSAQPSHRTRRFIRPDANGNAAGVLDWNGDRNALLDSETFHQHVERDALGRPTTLFNWHRESASGTSDRVAVRVTTYNERGLVAGETLHVRAAKGTDPASARPAIAGATYNARGQRLTTRFGNDTETSWTYDPATFRPTTIATRSTVSTRRFQDLRYTYDAVGNVTHIADTAQDTVYTNNAAIRPDHAYAYDATYRLIEATGRENPDLDSPPPAREGNWPRGPVPTAAVPRNYTQRYVYDAVGNFVEMRHRPAVGTPWIRRYQASPDSNRLERTWFGANTGSVTYFYDRHGNLFNLNAVAPPPDDPDDDWGRAIRWDWRDMIRMFDAIGGGTARYHYDLDKQRTRKIVTRIGGTVEDRIYLEGYELYRRHSGDRDDPLEEVESHHLFGDDERVLLVDDVVRVRPGVPRPPNGARLREQTLFRYQYGNHLGSASLELDDTAQVISYEEFHPYGSTAYRLMDSAKEVPAKRYRYSGMERDEESGLGYHHRRYLLSALGRWISADPAGTVDGYNLYLYASDNPIRKTDRSGAQGDEAEQEPQGRLPETSTEARRLAEYFYWKGDMATSKYYQALGHQMGVAEGLASARKTREQGNFASNALLVAMFATPILIVAALKGGLGVGAGALATRVPMLADPRVIIGMGLLYGFLAPPGAPDLPGTQVDDTGRAVKAASVGLIAAVTRRLRGRGGLQSAAAFVKFAQDTVERLVKGKMQLPRAEAERIVGELTEAATSGSVNSAAAVEKKIVELMELSTEMAEQQGFKSAVAGSSNRALGNRAHAYLRIALEALDLDLRSRSIGGERLGVFAEMFIKRAKNWVFEGRIKNALGLDAVFFSEGSILKGFDLKTGRLLSEGEMKPIIAAWKLTKETLEQVYGRGQD